MTPERRIRQLELALQEAIDTIDYLTPERFDNDEHQQNFLKRQQRLQRIVCTGGTLTHATRTKK